ADLVARFRAVLDECEVKLAAVVPGNHDRGWRDFAAELPMMPDGVDLGDWRIIHGDTPVSHAHVVLGHHHPGWRSGSRTRPCYLVGSNKIVMPAFSTDAAGGDVRSRWVGYRAIVIEEDR